MSCMQLPSHVKKSATMHLSRSYRPLWLTSNSFELPNYALPHPNLNKQVALILYYAHVLDQKKLLKDFFKLCKDSFENKCEGKVLESVVKAWIKQSIVKLHRRREQIFSNAVTTFQTEMIRTLSQILLSIFCDLLQESSDKVSSSLNAFSKKHVCGATVTNQCASSFFSESRVALPRTSNSKNFSVCLSELDKLFLSLPFVENKNLAMRVSENNPIDWLHKFWVTFCYQPNPTNAIYSHTAIKTTCSSHGSQNYIFRNTTVLYQTSEISISNKTTKLYQSCMSPKLTKTNLENHNKNFSIGNNRAMSLHESDEDSSTETSSTTTCTMNSTITWSEEDSDSSDSWSLTDLADEIPEEFCSNLGMSPGTSVHRLTPAVLWLETETDFAADFDCNDESTVFRDLVTEANCLERGGTNGSLHFVDTDDDDFDVMFSETSSTVPSFPVGMFEDKSQGYVNPSFEEEFRWPPVPEYIRSLNVSWNALMLETEDKPRQASKVSFAPEQSLVTVHCFEKTDENSYDASAILDRMRFQRRIHELDNMLTPFFTCEHRKEIGRRNCFYQD